MGLDIKIGNAVPIDRKEADCGGYGSYVFFVEDTEHPDAPCWPDNPAEFIYDSSGKSNLRSPGYTAFDEFLKRTGITKDDVPAFWERESGDCKCYVLLPEHRDAVSRARATWKTNRPGAIPGWTNGCDTTLARLIWYEWWMTWALEHAERPSIEMG